MNEPSCRGCPVFHNCNELTGCIHPNAVRGEHTDKQLERTEAVLREAICRLESATNNFHRFEEGGMLKAKAGERMAVYAVEVRNARRAYVQAVMNAYAVGITTNGQILWS
jgi:hypothetical protein